MAKTPLEKSKIVRAKFLPRPKRQNLHQLGHHVRHKEKPEIEHPVAVDFVLHNLTFVFDGVRR